MPATTALLRRSGDLLSQYAGLPMNYADATLVVLAEEPDTDLVLDTDRRSTPSAQVATPAVRWV